MRVLLIAGGWSNERDVSLSGAKGIGQALERLGHTVEPLDPATQFDQLLVRAKASDFAFINLHGSPGEDGLIQAMLDRVGCPYQGSGPAASFLALNKAASKRIFRDHAIATPDWELLPLRPSAEWTTSLPLPVFVKPNVGGSSLGMSLVRTPLELAPALEAVFNLGQPALIESYVEGPEITCGVLGDEALPSILIVPKGAAFFDYHNKYAVGGADEICPAPVEPALERAVRDTALKVHRLLGLFGVSRTDMIIRDDKPVVLEVNTLPGMTPTSLLPKSAAAAGLDFDGLIRRLMDIGLAGRT